MEPFSFLTLPRLRLYPTSFFSAYLHLYPQALGKILRINPNKNGAKSYSVPSDNPFIGDSSMIDEAFAIGFRNPHTFCFSNSGELFQGEVSSHAHIFSSQCFDPRTKLLLKTLDVLSAILL